LTLEADPELEPEPGMLISGGGAVVNGVTTFFPAVIDNPIMEQRI
jgi:hypothetical protein